MKKLFTCILIIALYPAFLFAKDNANSGHNLSGRVFHFVENKGQVTDQYRRQRTDISFSVPAKGLSVFIGNGQMHYQFAKTDQAKPSLKDQFVKTPNTKAHQFKTTLYRMDVTLIGANKQALATTEQQQPYAEHYYLPQTGKEGATAHSYDKITYLEIYPHIDWVLYIKDNKVEYDFVVKPGGNIADIKMKYDGPTALRINEAGSLVATTPMGSVEDPAPVSYQGSADKKIHSRYVLQDKILSFEVPDYNNKTTLVIDPTLTWQSFYGGSDNYDQSFGIATDVSGNVYVTGNTKSGTNIATTGAYQTVLNDSANGGDAFLAQYNSAGVLQWGTYYGGVAKDVSNGVACDATGNIYITGNTSSAGIATAGAYQATLADTVGGSGGGDVFLAKFNNTGALQWSTYYGGEGGDIGNSVACDGAGNVYITGNTASMTGIATAGAHQTSINLTETSIFIASFNSAGQLQWGTYYGGMGTLYPSSGNGITCDATGNIYVTGVASSLTGVATTDAYQSTLNFITVYNDDTGSLGVPFLSKFNNSGQLQWGTYYEGTTDYYYQNYNQGNAPAIAINVKGAGTGVTCDPSGNVYMCGSGITTTGWATPGAYQTYNLTAAFTNSFYSVYGCSLTPQPGGVVNAGYIAKFSSSGQRIWGTYYGGSAPTTCNSITSNAAGDIYVAGSTESDSGIATPGSYDTTFVYDTAFSIENACGTGEFVLSYDNSFLAKFDSVGSIQWSTYYGNDGNSNIFNPQVGAGVTCNASGIYMTGNTGLLSEVDTLFLAKFNDCSAPLPQPGAISGPASICPRSTNTYSIPAIAGATYYHWSLPAGWSSSILSTDGITTATTITATADSMGIAGGSELIAVTANNSCGSSAPQSLVLTIPDAISYPLSPVIICSGDSVKLSADTGTGFTYQWQFNGADINGATDPNYNFIDTMNHYQNGISQTGGQYQGIVYQYTVKITSGACIDTSMPTYVIVNPLLRITITGATSFCQGDSSVLMVLVDTAGGLFYGITNDTYQWQFNGNDISTSILEDSVTGLLYLSDTAKVAGIYSVIGTNTMYLGGSSFYPEYCPTKVSDTIVVNPLPVPVVSASGSTLATGSYSSYQWYYDGQGISGAVNQTYNPTDSGSYYVVVINSNGCAGQSAAYTYIPPTGISSLNADQQGVQLYPNPNNGQFTLSGKLDNVDGEMNIEIIDVTGKVLFKEKGIVMNGVLNKQMDMGMDVVPGMYTIKIVSGNKNIIIPFIKK